MMAKSWLRRSNMFQLKNPRMMKFTTVPFNFCLNVFAQIILYPEALDGKLFSIVQDVSYFQKKRLPS